MLISHRNGRALNRKRAFLFNAFLFFPLVLFAQFDFNSNCREAYREILSLHFKDAENLLESEKILHPANLIPLYLENQLDFLTVFIGEDPADFEKFRKDHEVRSGVMKEGNSNSPWYRYCL